MMTHYMAKRVRRLTRGEGYVTISSIFRVVEISTWSKVRRSKDDCGLLTASENRERAKTGGRLVGACLGPAGADRRQLGGHPATNSGPAGGKQPERGLSPPSRTEKPRLKINLKETSKLLPPPITPSKVKFRPSRWERELRQSMPLHLHCTVGKLCLACDPCLANLVDSCSHTCLMRIFHVCRLINCSGIHFTLLVIVRNGHGPIISIEGGRVE